jgi:hypothetical protein
VKLTAFYALALSSLLVAGCGMLQALEGGGSGGSGSSGATTGAGLVAQGIDCGVDPNTGATLCLGISICPGLQIDQEVFPMCGFRISGEVVDVECSCGGYLCPLGTTTCTDASTLLSQSNEGNVCAEVSAGTCIEGIPMAGAATSAAVASSSSSGGTCTMDCLDSCDNDPVCLQACGC